MRWRNCACAGVCGPRISVSSVASVTLRRLAKRPTRFRRYDGTSERPLLPEHDLSAKQFLLEPNHAYRIRLVARDGIAEYWRDGEKIFTFRDPAPLAGGWFALRTVRSHLVIRDLRITPLR